MKAVALSSKGQLIVPKTIRNRHNWKTGTRLLVIDRGNEVVIKSSAPFEATSFESPDSPSVYQGQPLTLDDMERAVADEAGSKNDCR